MKKLKKRIVLVLVLTHLMILSFGIVSGYVLKSDDDANELTHKQQSTEELINYPTSTKEVAYTCYDQGTPSYVRCSTAIEPNACLGSYRLRGEGLKSGIDVPITAGGTCEGFDAPPDAYYDIEGNYVVKAI